MGDEISVSGVGWGRWSSGAGIDPGNCSKPRDDDPCRSDQSRPCASADIDPAISIGVPFGTVSQREEFAQIVDGIPGSQKALLGSASMEQGVLGFLERERNR